MADHDIRIHSSADTSALDRVNRELEEMTKKAHAAAQAMNQLGATTGEQAGGDQLRQWHLGRGTSGGVAAPPPLKQRQTVRADGGNRFNLSTQSGLEEYTQSVLAPILPTLMQLMQAGTGGVTAASTIAATGSTVSAGGNMQKSIEDWFFGLGGNLKNMEPNARSAYTKAAFTAQAAANPTHAIQTFWNQWGSALGGPSPTPTVPTQDASSSLPPAAGGGGSDGGGPTPPRSGGGGKSPAPGMNPILESGVALGKAYIPFLTGADAVLHVASQVEAGYANWQTNATAISAISQSLGNAGQAVEQFRMHVIQAGAQFGASMAESAQAAGILTQSFGNLSANGVASLTGQAAGYGLAFGMTAPQMAAVMGTSATLGLTSGVGSSMTNPQLAGMLANMTVQGGMLGRESSMFSGYLGVANQIGATNPIIPNPQGLAGLYTSMSATGIQGLQGQRGASVLGALSQGMMNPSGYAQNLEFAAIAHARAAAGLGNVSGEEMLQLQQEGPSAIIPGTHTMMTGALLNQIRNTTSNPASQRLMLSMYGLSLPQAQALLGAHGFGSTIEKTPTLHATDQILSLSRLMNAQTPQQMQAVQNSLRGLPSSLAGPVTQHNMAQRQVALAGWLQSHPNATFSSINTYNKTKNAYRNQLSHIGSWVGHGMAQVYRVGGYGGMGLMLGAGLGMSAMGGGRVIGGVVRAGGGLLSRLGGIFGGGGEAAGGAAADAGAATAADLAGVGGVEAVGAGLDATGILAPIGLALGLGGAAYGAYQLLKGHNSTPTHSVHSAAFMNHTLAMHTGSNMRRSAAANSENYRINDLTINTLKINNLQMAGGASMAGSGVGIGGGSGSALAAALGNTSFLGPTNVSGNLSQVQAPPTFGQSISNTTNTLWNGPQATNPASPSQSAFVKKMLPYAQYVSKRTGLSTTDLLSQWALESGNGSSEASIADFNLAGIKPFGSYGPGRDSKYAGFTSLQQFAEADAQVLNQANYAGARAAAKRGASPGEIGYLLSVEGYDTSNPVGYGNSMQGIADSIGHSVATEIEKASKRQVKRSPVTHPQAHTHTTHTNAVSHVAILQRHLEPNVALR